jgi:hypothetical protein
MRVVLGRHSREGGNPAVSVDVLKRTTYGWIPAFAGMTNKITGMTNKITGMTNKITGTTNETGRHL